MTPTTSLAQQLALWADQLRDVSALGLRFSQNIYDREHFQTVQNIAVEMLALATNTSLEELEPLRSTVMARPTPFSTGDAAIINQAGEILLVQRADNQKWAMPGGAMAVGETPAEAVAREALEETGVRCQPLTLVGVYDSRFCGTTVAHHLYHFVFLCRPLNGGQVNRPPSHALEVLDTGWFSANALPGEIDPGHISRIPDAFRVWHGDERAFFDK